MNVFLLFNKTTKHFISYCESLENIPTDNFLVKEIPLESLGIKDGVFNLARYRWEGDYDTGELIDLFAKNKSVVMVEDVEKKYTQLFFRKYPLEQCLFEMMNILSDRSYVDEYPMLKFFKALRNKKSKELEFFKESDNHILESAEDVKKHIDEAFKV